MTINKALLALALGLSLAAVSASCKPVSSPDDTVSIPTPKAEPELVGVIEDGLTYKIWQIKGIPHDCYVVTQHGHSDTAISCPN